MQLNSQKDTMVEKLLDTLVDFDLESGKDISSSRLKKDQCLFEILKKETLTLWGKTLKCFSSQKKGDHHEGL